MNIQTQIKSTYGICPHCGNANDVVKRTDGSHWGSTGPKPVNNIKCEGGATYHYYCKKCNCDFDVKIEYKDFDKIPEGRINLK